MRLLHTIRLRSVRRDAGICFCLLAVMAVSAGATAEAAMYDRPDQGEPGDAMIQEYLRLETEKVEGRFLNGIKSEADWEKARPGWRREYFDMLGLWPLPEKTPLQAVVTRTLDRGDHVVEMVHYQSKPGLYVTGNLYRPAKTTAGEKLPAILYVCGHSPRGRNGNKAAYQSHGIWFARHGYICLVLDTLEMGELTCTHHGLYRESRWSWLSRGFTPAAVECWNGVRGIDYLCSLLNVDPDRIGVTGLSGGGAATFWIAAADERVKAAIPVSGFSDLTSHISHRVVNGHCDCMYNFNTYQWPYVYLAGMIAPRPLLFVNSDADPIFPMDGNERVINGLERIYSLMGAGDRVDSLVSIGGHAYRQDIRQAAFRFMNIHLKNDPRPVLDSEVDLVTSGPNPAHPIPPEQLRVFAQDSDFPRDARNDRTDFEFVPLAKAELPSTGQFTAWRDERLERLRQLSFHHVPDRVPEASPTETNSAGIVRLLTEAPIEVRLRLARRADSGPQKVWLYVAGSSVDEATPAWLNEAAKTEDAVYVVEPRGIGESRWTLKNPPNYVLRSLYLLGRTPDSGRVWDIAATARHLRAKHGSDVPICLAGEGPSAILAAYAALLEPDISSLALSRPPLTHLDNDAPQFLGVLRVIDIPQALGMLAPRPIQLFQAPAEAATQVVEIYARAGASDKLQIRSGF